MNKNTEEKGSTLPSFTSIFVLKVFYTLSLVHFLNSDVFQWALQTTINIFIIIIAVTMCKYKLYVGNANVQMVKKVIINSTI